MKSYLNIIGLIGRTNSGKSTLLNNFLGKKIAATANRVNTTRTPLTGLFRQSNNTWLLLDSPGILQIKTLMDRLIWENLQTVLNYSQILWWLIDVNDVWRKDNQILVKLLNNLKKPTLLVINKIDVVDKIKVMERIAKWQKKFPFVEIIPISAKNKLHFDKLLIATKKYLTKDLSLDISKKQFSLTNYLDIAKEIIREQTIFQTREELVHQTAIVLKAKQITSERMRLVFEIIVASQSQKGIILGKAGQKIKTIRQNSQLILMKLWQKKLQLFLQVKVIENWYRKPFVLKELGINWKGLD